METDAAEKSAAPRRSTRERKQATAIAIQDERPKKRKRAGAAERVEEDGGVAATGSENENDVDAAVDEGGDADEDSDADVDPDTKPRRKRVVKKVDASRKVTKPRAAPRRNKKAAANGDDAPAMFDHAQVAKEIRIPDDNPLFNTIINPAAALQSTAVDFLESYGKTSQLALSELVTCFLRSCGCSASVDSDEVLDSDGVVSKLDDFVEALMKETAPPYPLASKMPVLKKFRKSIAEFLHRLVAAASDLGILEDEHFIPTIQSWVIAMSSSQLRSFRHTATVIALEVETALCEVAATAEKEAETLVRQRDAEKKKKGRSIAREKELETKTKQANARRARFKEFIKEGFDGVFVHRFRDHHAEIRAECMHALGTWLKLFPAHFLGGEYLRYVGWLLSDADSHVRLEAVKSLIALYSKDDYIVTLRNFTERFKGRLLEMATSDAETSIRVSSIQVLCIIDSHSLLDDEQREALCLLVFDQEARVRKAISLFIRGVWSEDVNTRLSGRKASEKEKQRAGIKSLSVLLVQWTKALDSQITGDGDADIGASDAPGTSKDVALLVDPMQKSRIAFAVEGLWDEIDSVVEWESLLEYLLLDHSARGENTSTVTPSRRKKTATAAATDDAVDPAWRLEDDEEGFILEVAVASLRKTVADAKKTEGDTTQADITRTLMNALPRLFAKYQTDDKRICNVLLIPQFMSLDLFLEMRVISSYESLWDDVTKQFLSNPNPAVMNHATDTIRQLLSATSLSNTNSTKIIELEDELSSSLRDIVAGRDELEIVDFSDDDIQRLTAVATRVSILFGHRDMSLWMEEDEGGKQSSAWDIFIAIAHRGALGYRAEEMLVEQCIHVLAAHIIWKARIFLNEKAPSPDDAPAREGLKQKRDAFVEKLVELTVGQQSKPCERVARAAFQHLLSLHILFRHPVEDPDDPNSQQSILCLSMDEQTQYRCVGFVQSEIEKFADDVRPSHDTRNGHKSDESSVGSGSETEVQTKSKEKPSNKVADEKSADRTILSQSRLQREYATSRVLATFLGAIAAGAIDLVHVPVLLANYDRLEQSFDACARRVVDILRDEGMYRNRGGVVASVVTSALKEAFNLYLDDVVQTEDHAVALSKALSPAFIIRGAQLTVVRRLDSQHLVAVHTNSITWIVKQIQIHDSNKNMKMKRKALLFFKVLAPLLGSIDNRDALKIKAHVDQAFALAKLDIGVAKEWDPVRTYERRLSSKDKTIVPLVKGKRGRTKKVGGESSEDEAASDGHKDADGVGNEKSKKRSRARAPHKPRASKKTVVTDDDDAYTAPTGASTTTSTRRRSQRKTNGSRTGINSELDAASGTDAVAGLSEHEQDAVIDNANTQVNGNSSTPHVSSTRKRRRVEDDDQAATADSPSSVMEYKSRRKRVRAAI